MTDAELIEIAIASAQFLAAILSLWAAWSIARSQKDRADFVVLRQQLGYFDTVLVLVREAIEETEKVIAQVAMEESQPWAPHDAMGTWAVTIDGLASAIRGQWPNAPANARLVITVGRLLIHMDKKLTWEGWDAAATASASLAEWCEPLKESVETIEKERRFWPLLSSEVGRTSVWDRLRWEWWPGKWLNRKSLARATRPTSDDG